MNISYAAQPPFRRPRCSTTTGRLEGRDAGDIDIVQVYDGGTYTELATLFYVIGETLGFALVA